MVQVIQERNKFEGLAEALQGIIQGQAARHQRQKVAGEIASINQFLGGAGGPQPQPTTQQGQSLLSQGLSRQMQFERQQSLAEQQRQAAMKQAIEIQKIKSAGKAKTPLEIKQEEANLAKTLAQTGEIGKDKDATKSQFVAELGSKIADGTATDKEREVFNSLTATAGTTVNVNTGEGIPGSIREQIEGAKEGQAVLNEFTSDPTNEQILKNSDVNMVTNSKGQLQLEIKPKATPAATQVKELSDLIGLQNSIGTMDSLYDKSFVGPVRGNKALASFSEATGVGTNTREVQFRRVTADLADRLLRARSGAQINEQEFKRLSKILPEPSLSPVAFRARQESFANELADIIKVKQDVLEEAGFRSIGRKEGTAEKAEDVLPLDLEGMSDEELEELERSLQ